MKNFISTFIIASVVFFTLLGGLVIGVDPYDKLGINIFGFETKAVASSRENKFRLLENSQDQYKAFILGSSTAHRYDTYDVEKLTGLKTFNYAVQHTTVEDYWAIFNHITSKFQPELIILQVEFASFSKNFKVDQRLSTSPLKDYLKDKVSNNKNVYFSENIFSHNYFTLEAIRDSLRVIYTNWLGEARHVYLEHGNYKKEKPTTGKIKMVQSGYGDYKASHRRYELLNELVQACKHRGIKLVLISTPHSIEHYERIQNDPMLKAEFAIYKAELSDITPHFYDFTTEQMRQYSTNKYFRNSTHITKEFSRKILEQIFAKQ